MKLLLLATVTLGFSFAAWAEDGCQNLAVKSAITVARLNQPAMGTSVFKLESVKLVTTDANSGTGRAPSHDTYSVTLTDGRLAHVVFTVKTDKDNDEVGQCAIQSVETGAVFN